MNMRQQNSKDAGVQLKPGKKEYEVFDIISSGTNTGITYATGSAVIGAALAGPVGGIVGGVIGAFFGAYAGIHKPTNA